MSSVQERMSPRRRRRMMASAVAGLALVGSTFVATTAEAAGPVSGDIRATAVSGQISACPSDTTPLLQTSDGNPASTPLVTATISNGGRYLTLSFATSLNGATVTAYVKGGSAYNVYDQIIVGAPHPNDSADLHAPLNSRGNIPAVSHYLVCQTGAPPPTPQFDSPPGIYLGYADDFHGVSGATSFKPSPWKGSPGVVYLGCDGALECGGAHTGKFDSGAIRIDNADADTPLKLVGASVAIGPCLFQVWTNFLPATAAPGGKFVLTQTGVKGHPLPQPCAAAVDPLFHDETNFDTSERPGDTREPSSYNCNPTERLTPVITLTFEDGPAGPDGDVTLTVNDSGRILNTGGVDSFACQSIDEAQPWTGPVFYTLP